MFGFCPCVAATARGSAKRAAYTRSHAGAISGSSRCFDMSRVFVFLSSSELPLCQSSSSDSLTSRLFNKNVKTTTVYSNKKEQSLMMMMKQQQALHNHYFAESTLTRKSCTLVPCHSGGSR